MRLPYPICQRRRRFAILGATSILIPLSLLFRPYGPPSFRPSLAKILNRLRLFYRPCNHPHPTVQTLDTSGWLWHLTTYVHMYWLYVYEFEYGATTVLIYLIDLETFG